MALLHARIAAACDAGELLRVVASAPRLNSVHATSALRRLGILQRAGRSSFIFDDERYLFLEKAAANELDARGLAAAAQAATLLARPSLLDLALAAAPPRLLKEANLVELSCIALSIGKLQQRSHHGVLMQLGEAAASLLADYRPCTLALAVLQEAGGPSLRALSTVNPASLTRLSVGFAASGTPMPRRLVGLLGAEAVRQLPLFSAAQLTALLSAHARLGQAPNAALIRASSAALLQTLPAANAQQVLHALVAYARLRAPPSEPLLAACDARLLAEGPSGIRKMPPALVLAAARALGKLGAEHRDSRALLLQILSQRCVEEGTSQAGRAGASKHATREVWLAPRKV